MVECHLNDALYGSSRDDISAISIVAAVDKMLLLFCRLNMDRVTIR